jgi:hypothetical protein
MRSISALFWSGLRIFKGIFQVNPIFLNTNNAVFPAIGTDFKQYFDISESENVPLKKFRGPINGSQVLLSGVFFDRFNELIGIKRLG